MRLSSILARKAVVEVAIVMDDMLGSIRTRDLSRSRKQFALFQHESVTHQLALQRVFGEPGIGRFNALGGSLNELQSQIQDIRDVTEMAAWGVNLLKYARFRRMTSIVQRMASGHVNIVHYCNMSLSDNDVNLCIQFILKRDLSIESKDLAPSFWTWPVLLK